jgi:hypothetical protein
MAHNSQQWEEQLIVTKPFNITKTIHYVAIINDQLTKLMTN